MGITAKRIKTIRDELGLSQSALARYGVPQRAISDWENGANSETFERLATIAHSWGVSADWLLGLTDIQAPITSGNHSESLMPELENVFVTLSHRAQRESLEIVKALAKVDRQWQGYDLVSESMADSFGEERLEILNDRLSTLATALGSMDAAIDHLLSLLPATENIENSPE